MASIAYSRCGCILAQYDEIKVAFASSVNDLQTMNSKRLAVFAASLQCTGEVNVLSKVAPSFLPLATGGGDDCRLRKKKMEKGVGGSRH